MLGSLHSSKRINILALHHSVHGAVTGPHEWKMTEELKEEEITGPYDIVFSGHYHKHQTVGKLTYVGAPLHHDLGERDYKPGIVYVNPDGSWEHIKNTVSPRFTMVEAKEESDIIFKNTKDYKVIRWKGSPAKGYALINKYPKSLIEIKPETVDTPTRTTMETTDSVDDLLEKFVVHKKGKVEEKLLEIGKKIYDGE
jgi:DNA repair exonuclease SbcCD nuclease subunit